eukprot:gene33022-55587_t
MSLELWQSVLQSGTGLLLLGHRRQVDDHPATVEKLKPQLEIGCMSCGVANMKVGFIGLGRMGQGMARNLLKGGASLVVYDASTEAMAHLVADGATSASNLRELVQQVDVVFTSLPGPAQVEEVVFGADGIVKNMRSGLVHFDLSTSSMELSRRIDLAYKEKGGSMLDSPVSGGPQGAASGDLAIWVGGDRAVFDQYKHLLNM